VKKAMMLLLCVVAVGSFLLMKTTEPEPTTVNGSSKQIENPKKKEVVKRRSRQGPRKPSSEILESLQKLQNAAKEASTGRNDPEEGSKKTSSRETDLAEKLQEYLDVLDSIEEPSVSELTLLGELAFEANDPASAYDHYLEVIEQHSDDPQASFALYKFAWVQYNLGDVEAAINDMSLVLEWIDTESSSAEQALRPAAAQDLELFKSKKE